MEISEKGKRFIRYYSLYMGKLEELETIMFHLGDTRIYIPCGYGEWKSVKPKDLANWYEIVNNTYLEVNEEERVANRYEWMLNNVSERIGVCIVKIKVLEDK